MNLFEEYKADAVRHQQTVGSGHVAPIFSLQKFDWDRRASKSQLMKDLNPYKSSQLIQEVVVSNNIMVIAATNNCVLRWNVMDSRDPERIEIVASTATKMAPGIGTSGSNPSENLEGIERIFMDPTANHVIIAMKNMDNYYLHSRSQRPRKLTRLPGLIECVAFDKQNCTESSTRSFLVGTSTGTIFEMCVESTGKEKYCNPLYQLEQTAPINSIYFDYIGGSGGAASGLEAGGGFASGAVGSTGASSGGAGAGSGATGATGAGAGAGEGDRLFVMWSTTTPARLYHVTGGPSLQALFASYVSAGATSFTELPGMGPASIAGPLPAGAESNAGPGMSSSGGGGIGGAWGASGKQRALLYCYTPKSNGAATSYSSPQKGSSSQHFALLTEMGIYHGSLLFSSSAGTGAASASAE
jgi:hypothetical protein